MSLLEKAIQYLRELKHSHASQDYATAGEVWDVLLARYDRDELCGPSAKTPQNTLSTVLLREAGKPNGKIRRVVNSYGKYAYQYVGESNASPRITPAVDNKPIYAPTPSYSPANSVTLSSSAIPQAQEKPEPSQPRPKIMLLEKAIQYLRELKHSHASQDYATAGEVWDALEARYDRDELCGRDAKTPQFTLSTDLLRESRKENGRVQADEVNGHRVYRYNDGSNMTNNVNIRQLCKKQIRRFRMLVPSRQLALRHKILLSVQKGLFLSLPISSR